MAQYDDISISYDTFWTDYEGINISAILSVDIYDYVNIDANLTYRQLEARYNIYDCLLTTYDDFRTDYDGISIYIGIHDTITISELFAVFVPEGPDVADAVAISEDLAITLSNLEISINDPIIISEYFDRLFPKLNLIVNEVVSINDFAIFPNISPFVGPIVEFILIEEYNELYMGMTIAVYDAVSITESKLFTLTYDVDVFDVFGIVTEWADTAPFYYWIGPVSEDITIDDSYVHLFDIIELAISESLVLSEMVVTFLPLLVPNCFDSITVGSDLDLGPIMETLSLITDVTFTDEQDTPVEIVRDMGGR